MLLLFLGIPGSCSQENGTPVNLSGVAGARGESSGKYNTDLSEEEEEVEEDEDNEKDENEADRREEFLGFLTEVFLADA